MLRQAKGWRRLANPFTLSFSSVDVADWRESVGLMTRKSRVRITVGAVIFLNKPVSHLHGGRIS